MPYQWRVAAPDLVVSRLLGIIEGCLCCSPVPRLTVPRIHDALTSLSRGVDPGYLGPVGGTATTATATPPIAPSPVAIPTAGVTYDVLAMVEALVIVRVDDAVIGAVADAIGHQSVSTLDVWRACGVPPMKAIEARRLITAREGIAQVCLSGGVSSDSRG